MNCGNCKLRYNTTKRRPIISKCLHTICESCRILLEKCPRCKQTFNKNIWIVNQDIQESIKNSNVGVDILVKVCFIGNSGTGKTSLIRGLMGQQFTEFLHPTCGIDFKYIDKEFNGLRFRLQLWDTAGQQRYQSMFTSIYKDADIIVLVYDSQKERATQIAKWELEIQQRCRQNVPIVYVANKTDLLKQTNSVAEELTNDLKTSCKTKEGVDKLWTEILKIATKMQKIQQPPKSTKVNISANEANKRKISQDKKKQTTVGTKKQKSDGGCC